MRTITFTAEDRWDLARDRYYHPDPRVQRKMEVFWLKSHGLNHDDIAAYMDVSRRTVQRDLDEDLEGGLPRLRRCQGNHPQSALVEHEASLEEYFQEHPPRSVKQAQALIEQRTGVRRGLSQVRHFLKDRFGLRWRQVGAIPVPPRRRSKSTPKRRRPSWRRNWSHDWNRPARAGDKWTSWTPPTSCSRRSWAACGARRGGPCGRPRVASGTTSWGRWTR